MGPHTFAVEVGLASHDGARLQLGPRRSRPARGGATARRSPRRGLRAHTLDSFLFFFSHTLDSCIDRRQNFFFFGRRCSSSNLCFRVNPSFHPSIHQTLNPFIYILRCLLEFLQNVAKLKFMKMLLVPERGGLLWMDPSTLSSLVKKSRPPQWRD